MTTMAESAKFDIDNLGDLSDRFHKMSNYAAVMKGLTDLSLAFSLISDHLAASQILMKKAYRIMEEKLDNFHTDVEVTK
ncbi:MAG: hypothetical protein IJT54_05985 [Candidatus Methanomethylophilaceae archaeon]|nr:hypothetical protein [Candidatus Methanomethylophilaceae archaeon]